MALPTLTLTDPQNLNADMSLPMSPTIKSPDTFTSFEFERSSGRPGTASSVGDGVVRPDTASSSSRPSPGRLRKTQSNTNSSHSREPSPGRHASLRQDLRAPIDPLSQQILQRTTGSQTLPNALRPTSSAGASVQEDAKHQHAAMSAHAPPPRSDTNEPARKELKKGVKAVTFLGRLIGGKKKSPDQAIADDEPIESRPEGTEAHVFAQPLDSMEYNPRHPPPPAYIKVRSKFKARRDFDRLFLAQELYCGKRRKLVRTETNKLRRKSSASTDQEAVWAMEFSKDGKYLAAAGADMVLRVWQVLSNPEDRRKTEASSSGDSRNGVNQGERLSAPVFATQPIREWAGHGSTILDLSWSKNNFLLSSSMDKTVRLWHVSREQCICTFKHNDFVPSIAFHPKDDRFFLAGSLDSKLRLWSIPDKSVAFTVQAPEMITAVAFTPDGRYAMAGCLDGQCLFYETESLKYQTQLHVRSAKGPNARGSKITAIQAYHGSSGDVKLLITSNDSRVRLYNFRDKSLELKFRGMQNNASQIRATLSDDGRYVVCGSEDRKAFIWSLNGVQDDARDKQPVEIFEAHESPTTVACFAPTKTRHILGRSEDPVYDLCNPPPVTLLSQRERTESHASSRPATENGSYMRTSLDVRGSLDRPRESFVHTAKSLHKSGNIIVTADFTGTIKIFRQDCAWNKRKGEDWDRSSVFGKRSGGGGGKSSRSNSIAGASIATKASQRSLRDGRTSAASQNAPSDRILSWRQGIASTSNVTNGSGASQKSKATSRSVSPPQKSPSNLRSPKSSVEETSPTSTAPTSLEVTDSQDTIRRTLQEHKRKNDPNQNNHNHNHNDPAAPSPTESPDSDIARRRDEGDGMVVDAAGRSDFFWDTARLREPLERQRALKAQAEDDERNARFLDRRPSRVSVNSAVSRLTAENSEVSDVDEFNDAEEEGPEKRMVCRRCGGTGFAAMRGAEGFRLVCEGCGLRVKPPVEGG